MPAWSIWERKFNQRSAKCRYHQYKLQNKSKSLKHAIEILSRTNSKREQRSSDFLCLGMFVKKTRPMFILDDFKHIVTCVPNVSIKQRIENR